MCFKRTERRANGADPVDPDETVPEMDEQVDRKSDGMTNSVVPD